MSKADEKASVNPLMVMADEVSGSRYASAVAQKGLGDGQARSWFVDDMCAQIRAWGHAGGAGGEVIVKCDGEPALLAVKGAVLKHHGGNGDTRATRQRRAGGERVGGRSREDGQGICMRLHITS